MANQLSMLLSVRHGSLYQLAFEYDAVNPNQLHLASAKAPKIPHQNQMFLMHEQLDHNSSPRYGAPDSHWERKHSLKFHVKNAWLVTVHAQ